MKHLVVFAIFLLCVEAFGQKSVEDLKKSREKMLKEIEYANQLLKETQGKTKKSLNEINLINHKLSKRKEILVGLEVEVNILNDEIERNTKDIAVLEQEIADIKKVYAAMITNLYKNRISGYGKMYFAASEDFSQLYKRIHTVKLYNNYLRKEREKLELLLTELDQQNRQLEDMKQQKSLMVQRTQLEASAIQKEMNEKNQVVRQLRQRQKEIEAEIKNKEIVARKLESEMKKILEEERKKSSTGPNIRMTPEEKLISDDFEKNVGKLPWPTQRGIITGKYGTHPHPDYKGVMLDNDGIYITTTEGEIARSVFKGVVSRVFRIPSEPCFSVIIKHGQYFSVYHNLSDVKVKAGQTVNMKDVIGTVFTDARNKETVLYFMIWKDKEKTDPELWLAPM